MKKFLISVFATVLTCGLYGNYGGYGDDCIQCIEDYDYINVFGSPVWHLDQDLREIGGTTFDYLTGYGGGVAIGHKKGEWRYELEGRYSYSKIDSVVRGSSTTKVSGDSKYFTCMLNGFYDFDVTDCVHLYGGGGFGLSTALVKYNYSSGLKIGHNRALHAGIGIQFLVGFAVDINDTWALTSGYRVFITNASGHSDGSKTQSVDIGFRARI